MGYGPLCLSGPRHGHAIASTLSFHCCGYGKVRGNAVYRERCSSEVEWVRVKDIVLCVTEVKDIMLCVTEVKDIML